LQDDPVRLRGFCRPHQRHLFLDRLAEDGEAERRAAADILGNPLHQRSAFLEGEFCDFGGETERGDAGDAGFEAELDLAAHGGAVEPLVLVEEGVEDGVNAANGHLVAPMVRPRTSCFWKMKTKASTGTSISTAEADNSPQRTCW